MIDNFPHNNVLEELIKLKNHVFNIIQPIFAKYYKISALSEFIILFFLSKVESQSLPMKLVVVAAVSCSSVSYRLGGVDRCIFVTGKPCPAWVCACLHGIVVLNWGFAY